MDHNFMKKNLLFHASKVKIQTKYNYSNEWQKKYNKFKKITQISWDTYFFIIFLNKKFQI